jgi:predicted MFS family arabinose efflux permease
MLITGEWHLWLALREYIVYVTTMLAGGALGSAVGAQAYEHWGWLGRHPGSGGVPVAGLFCWLASRRHERGPAQTASA